MKRSVILLLAAVLFSVGAVAVEPHEMLKDPALEARARVISKELRCVQCQNETIDDSNAEIARDMRVLVRERLTAGDSNQQIIDYMVSRYGDYVRLKPRFMPSTLILWLAPLLILLIGAFVVARRMREALQSPDLASVDEATGANTDSGDKIP
jgi:cytochrome c-type biogenesis protein CcmH